MKALVGVDDGETVDVEVVTVAEDTDEEERDMVDLELEAVTEVLAEDRVEIALVVDEEVVVVVPEDVLGNHLIPVLRDEKNLHRFKGASK